MAKGYKHGAGGGSIGLNFEVVAYATEEELMAATPKENTIGVITGDEITAWEFSATEPTAPLEGMVWILTRAYSTAAFSATKKKPIMVYPNSAKQYVGGAWVNKKAKTFQGDKWVDWAAYLYNTGDTCDVLTGGWIAQAWNFAGGAANTTNPPTLNLNADHLYAKGAGGGGVVRTANKIDLTNYSVLKFDGILYSGDPRYSKVCVWQDVAGYWEETAVIRVGNPTTNGTDELLVADVSALTGEYYIGIGLYYTSGAAVTMRKLWLE